LSIALRPSSGVAGPYANRAQELDSATGLVTASPSRYALSSLHLTNLEHELLDGLSRYEDVSPFIEQTVACSGTASAIVLWRVNATVPQRASHQPCRTRGRLRRLRGRLLHLVNQHKRLPQQGSQLPAFLDGLACIPPMLQRVFVAAWSARSRRTAMHPTASFSTHRRRHAGFARARFGPAAPARQHRTSITRMMTRHLFVCAAREPPHAPVRQGSSEEVSARR
jgi:hypothetical protein